MTMLATETGVVRRNGTLVVSNRYDHLGRRVQKIAADGTHTFVYDGWRPVVETVARSGGGTDRIEYYWGKDLSGSLDGAAGVGGLLYVKRNGAIYVPFYDAFGNIMGYWDANGAVVAEYVYDAFGRTMEQTGPLSDAFAIRYSTKYYDTETGMYYYGKRFYMTSLCRWLTRDPIEEEGGVNLYGFCGNNSISSFDRLGCYRFITRALFQGRYGPSDAGEMKNSRQIISLVQTLKKTYDVDAEIVDMVLTPIADIKAEIEANADNVYIVCHGGLHKDGKFLSTNSTFYWPYIGSGGVGEGFDIAHNGVVTPLSAFGSKLRMDNVFACYLAPGHRKVRRRIIDQPESSTVHLPESMERILSALQKYKKKSPCKVRVRIYEGEYDGRNVGTVDALENYPLKPEDEYYVKEL